MYLVQCLEEVMSLAIIFRVYKLFSWTNIYEMFPGDR